MHKPYEALGWKVFPLHGKAPYRGWQWKGWGHTYDARNYEGSTGIAVICLASGLVVIDVDTTRGDGHADLAEIEKKHGLNLRSCCKALCLTGRDGLHYYFDAPQKKLKFKGELTPTIDIRADAYVAAPPSIHPDTGVFYEWEIAPRQGHYPVPEALLALMVKEVAQAPPPRPPSLPYEGESIVERIRADAHIPSLLMEAGYRQVGERWLSPRSSSGVPAVKIMDDGKVYSHHSSASCAIAAAQTGHSMDAVDIMCTLRYGGDRDAMMEAYSTRREAPVWDSALVERLKAYTAPKKKAKRPRHRLDELAKDIQPWDLPGRAREVYDWIDSQCVFQRQHLAAGAALWVISCLAGMRHVDARDEINLNLLIFAVAGSATGKEAIIQAATRLLAAVGVTRALHGKIKSEQEIYRNLVDHQAAFYLIDEVGIMMQKITNATNRGGAVYLEGVIGAIMEISTKSQGMLAITGDQKRDLIESLEKRIAILQKALDNGRSDDGTLDSLHDRIAQAEQGLQSPYLTLFGATTPQTFDQILTPENAQNGLLGRALVIREHEDNPPRRGRLGPKEPQQSLVAWLTSLYWGKNYDIKSKRVERQGEVVPIGTDADAAEMLEEIYGVFFEIAEEHKERTGLAAIPRRGWEMVAKISMILGIADGRRTAQHVLYAYALARADVDGKLRFAFANAEEDQASDAAAILSTLSLETGKTAWEIGRANARLKRIDLAGALSGLEKAGRVRSEKTSQSVKYFLI